MEEQELETLLHHLGQDIAYMGHCVQKDVQKCLKDLTATHDPKRFCNKLTGILKRFSEYTIQYSKDLEGRIKEYNKEEDFGDITKTLQEIATKTVSCRTCKIKEKLVESSGSLVLSSNNNADEESTKYLDNEVLSQSSLHIGGADEIKSEHFSQTHSPDVQNEDTPTSTNDFPNDEGPRTQQEPEISSIHDDYESEQNVENNRAGSFDNDTDVANSLEISHSEDIPSVEDEEEATVCISGATSGIKKSKPSQYNILTGDTVENPPIPLPYEPIFKKDANVNLDNGVHINDSNKSQKVDVIPLPYKPISEKENFIEECGDLNHDINELPKLDVIALPYKPILEKSGDSDVCLKESISISANGAKSSSLEENILKKEITPSTQKDAQLLNLNSDNLESTKGNIKELHTDEIDDSYIEVVSVASSNEENDSDIEIIENIPPETINISDLACASNNNSQSTEEKIDSDSETVKNTSPRAAVILGTLSQGHSSEKTAHTSINESQITAENLDSDAETVKNTSPRVAAVLGTLPEGHSSKEIVAHINESQSTAGNVDSDADTVKNTSSREVVVLGTLSQGQSIEEIIDHINKSQSTEENLDSDADTVKNTSPRAAVVLETLSQGHSGEEIVAASASINKSQCTEENLDSDAETVKSPSPRAAVMLETLPKGQSSKKTVAASASINESQRTEEIFDSDASQAPASDEIVVARTSINESHSTNDLIVQSKETEDSDDTIITSPLHEAAVLDRENHYISEETPNVTQDSDSDDIYSKATQKNSTVAQKDGSNHSADIETQNGKTVFSNGESTDVTESGDSPEEGQEVATQDIEISQTKCVLEGEDVVMEDCEVAMLSQRSYVFDCATEQDSKVSCPEIVASDSTTTLTVKGAVTSPDNKNENLSECGDKNDDNNLSIPELSESGSSNTFAKTKKKLKEKDRKSLLKVIAEYFLKRTRERSEIANENENEHKGKTKKELKKSPDMNIYQDSNKTEERIKDDMKGSAKNSNNTKETCRSSIKSSKGSSNKDSHDDDDDEDPDMTQKVYDIRKLKGTSSAKINDKDFDHATQNASKNSTEHFLSNEEVVSPFKRKTVRPLPNTQSDAESDENNQVASPFKKIGVKRLHSSDESDSEPPKKISEVDESDMFDCEMIKPFKRKRVNKLQSTDDDESEAFKKTSEEDSDIERGPKRKKFSRLSSEQNSPDDQNDGQEMRIAENDPYNQFILDDKARDDFLDLFDQPSDQDQKSSTKESLKEQTQETDREDDISPEASQFRLSDCDRDNLLDLLTDKENERRNDKDQREPSRLNSMSREPQDMSTETSSSGENNSATSEPLNTLHTKDNDEDSHDGVANRHSPFILDSQARDDFLDLLNGDSPTHSEHMQDKNQKKDEKCDSEEDKTTSDEDSLVRNSDKKGESIEPNIERGPKRKRVSSLNRSEQKSPNEMVSDQKDGQEMRSSENDPYNQFILDDKARDDFLDLFDQPSEDQKSSTKEGLKEQTQETDRDDDISPEASQFRLSDCDRDNLLDLLTDKENERRNDKDQREPPSSLNSMSREPQDMSTETSSSGENNSATSEPLNTLHTKDNDEDSHDGVANRHSPFILDSQARDDFLDLLNGDSPTHSEHMQDKNQEKDEKCDSEEDKATSAEDNLIRNSDECIEPNQFLLTSADRDELLELLTNEESDDSRTQEQKQVNNSNKSATDIHTTEKVTYSNGNIDKNTLKSEDVHNGDEKGRGEDINVVKDELGDKDDIDDAATENSQGIDDFDESEEEEQEEKAEDDDEMIINDRDDEIDNENTAAKSAEFKLDENERDELLILLSDHMKKREMDSSDSDSDKATDKDNENGTDKKNKRKSRNVDRDILLELLQEYENHVAKKGKELVENIKNGDMEFANMDSENANSDFGEDPAADSESVLLDLVREETVEEPVEGQRRKKIRNSSKEAWKAYRHLLKDSEELSDTSLELSDIDIEDFEVDLSDQERKHKERKLHDNLRKKFNIEKELIVNVEQTDISQFDLSLLPRRGQNSSKIDRLCDLSNVLQKRKQVERKKRKVKRKKLSSSSSSECENSVADSDDSRSSSSTRWSDCSLRANQDASSTRDSPFLHLSDDNSDQEKLANTLWENIKNSSDENSGWSSDSETSDDEDKKKKGNGGRGGGKKGKKKKESDDEEEKGTGDDTSSEKSESDDSDIIDDETGDGEETNEGGAKDADLDSSDEEDFVGVRKSKGAWKQDPLLKSCFTSDDEESWDSDSAANASPKKARSNVRNKKRSKRKEAGSLDAEYDGTPTEDNGNSTDSDVEFIMEKQKTPKKIVEIDDEVEDESPSKRGAGRRNIRALFEDDELAEATKKAKKEETERIKRLQERERAKETFTQSQSFGSQLSEDESEPLILDVNENLQIKVHPKITKKLKPHQRTGIQFMWDSCYESVEQLKKGYEGSGCILAHCMGLGKTLQALGLIHTLFNHKEITKTKHVLVVCPLSTVSNWRNEFRLAYKDVKHCKVQLYTIQDKKVASQRCKIVGDWWRTGGVLVMGYECFGIMINDQKWEKWEKQIGHEKKDVLKALVSPGPDLVICDEGHLLRNKQTQRTLALNKIATKRRIVLTGTPLQNNLLEYYYMVNFVKPNLLGTEKEYKTNFINPISNGQFENSTAIDILFMKKRTHVLHKILNKTVQRVEDTELKKYLPELIDQALFIKLSDLQIGFYNTYLDVANSRPVEYTAAGNISRKNFLADIQILRYICTHPDVVTIAKSSVKSKIREQDVIDDILDDGIDAKVFSKGDWYKALVPESGVKKLELGTKMMVTLGIVKEAIATDDKVLIFSQFHAEMDSLEFFLKQELNYKKGVDYNRMDGTISPEVRTHMCDKFNKKNNTRLRVFIMSTQVGGLGLNLTAASRVILMNVNWNPSYDTQSVFRAFRFGQNKAVYVYRLIALDTMEEKMYQRQVTKLAVAHRVVDKHQITRHYSAADIQEFYSARPSVEGERPLPNVPDDRVLAKLIQKFQFLYKWHEHQALLANRPEEDLNEQQKNAAWEEFNKKAVEPPPPLPQLQPQFVGVGNLLNQPGPSGLQNVNMTPGYPPPLPRPNKRPRARKSPRLNKVPNLVETMSTYQVPTTLPVLIKQTEYGPKLVVQARGRIPAKEIPLRLGYSTYQQVITDRASRPVMTVSVIDRNRGIESAPVDVTQDDDAARKIQEINSLISAQTTPELISGFSATTANSFATSSARAHSSRIDEINSLTSAILSQHDDVSASSQDWAEDGMNATLLNLNLPDDDSEDSTSGHFADHSYSLPKANLLNFTTSSVEDFLPKPSPKFNKIPPRPLFVDVDAPLDLDPMTPNIKHNKHKIYKRYTVITQRTNSADDFRTTQTKYVPRPVFVDVQAPLGPRPNLSGINPSLGQRSRPSSTSKPVQNQILTNPVQRTSLASPQQVRLGNAITITQNSGTKTNPPPAHAQKPSISIIPQPASTRTGSNATAPRPYVPKSSNVVQNPLNLTRSRQIMNKKQPTRNEAWIHQKEKNKLVNGPDNDLGKSKRTASSTENIISTLPPKIVVAPPSRTFTAPAPLVKQLTKSLPPPLLTCPVTLPTSSATSASDPVPVSTTTAATPTQQSPLQKQMRNFMEHLHNLQLRMKPTEEEEANNLGDSNWGHVYNPTGTNQGIPTNINSGNRPNNTNASLITRNNIVGGTASIDGSGLLPSRTVVRVGGPNSLSPVIGGPRTTTNGVGLNAARNLSNITKTYQKSQHNKVVGVPLLTPISTSQSPAHHPRSRVVGTLPSPNTSKVILAKNTGSNVPYTNGNYSPRVVRKMITNSPRGVTRNVMINPTRQATNGNVPRVITKVVSPKSMMMTNSRVNPVKFLNRGNVSTKATRIVPGDTIRISPVLTGHKKIVISHKNDAQQIPALTNPSPIRLDLLQKKLVASLNKGATTNVTPKQLSSGLQAPQSLPSSLQILPIKLPSAPQRSFNNGTNMKTYQASRKNNPPSRSSSLPSLPQSGFVSKSNKENRSKRKLTFRTNNNTSSESIDLSNDEDNGNNSSGSLSRDMVDTLKKKGVSVNYLGKGNDKSKVAGL